MRKLQFLLLIFILFLVPKTFCADYNVSSLVSASAGGTKGKYQGFENYLYGSNNTYNIGTRYDGRLGKIDFFLSNDDWDWQYNTTYTITLNMATEDWRNNFMGPQVYQTNTNGSIPSGYSNLYKTNSFQFISMKKIKFNFTTPSYMGIYTKFTVYSGNWQSSAMTGVSNWNLSSIVISTTSSGGGSSGGGSGGSSATPTPTPSTATNNDIINNNNSNTQSIIDNNNSNTTDIIDNNNSNTQSIIDNNNANTTCPSGPLAIDFDNYVSEKGKYLDSTGTLQSSTSYGVSKYFLVKPDTEYKLKLMSSISSTVYYCLYRQNGNVIACYDLNSTEQTITTTSLTTYIRFTLRAGRIYYLTGPVCNDWDKESINSINDSLTDDNVDSGTGSDFFSDFEDEDFGLSSIITIPLNTIQSLTSSSCVALELPIPFTNGTVSLPCMTQVYQTHIPTIYNLWKIVSFGLVAYFIAIDIFHMVKGFKDPESDKVEVLDL